MRRRFQRRAPKYKITNMPSSVICACNIKLEFCKNFFLIVLNVTLGPLSSAYVSNSVSDGSRLRVAYQVATTYTRKLWYCIWYLALGFFFNQFF